MIENIKVSIIVPVYNIESYIERCLKSIISQSLQDIEIIVVNDGSTDNSDAIIDRFVDIDERIIVINKSNGGLSSARNAGIAIAKGEYLLHVDGDDWIEQDYLISMHECAERNNCDVVISDYWKNFDNGYKTCTADLPISEDNIIDGLAWLDKFFNREAGQSMFNKLFKTSLYKSNNIEHPLEVSVGEDLATTPRLMYYANRIGKVNKCYYHYIQRQSSLTNSIDVDSTDKSLRSLMLAFIVLKDFFYFAPAILEKISKYRAAQIAIFIFTPNINKESELMGKLVDEYLWINSKNSIRYSTKRMQLYSNILKIANSKSVLRLLQNINGKAQLIYSYFRKNVNTMANK